LVEAAVVAMLTPRVVALTGIPAGFMGARCQNRARQAAQQLAEYHPILLPRPAPGRRDASSGDRAASPIEKIKDEYRWQLWHFTNAVTKVVSELAKLRAGFAWPDDITQVLDVDPTNLM
jgi:hypothetical protein